MIGRIYKIYSEKGNEVYIGSTTNKLKTRYSKHCNDYKRYLNGMYPLVTSFELFSRYGTKECKIELLEELNVNNLKELYKREAEFIEIFKENKVNRNNPFSLKIKTKNSQNRINEYEKRKKKYHLHKEFLRLSNIEL